MERNDESLSTRDLAGIDSPVRGADGEPTGNDEQPNNHGRTTTDVGGQPSTPTRSGEASTATDESRMLDNGGGVHTEPQPREEYSGPPPSDRDRGESVAARSETVAARSGPGGAAAPAPEVSDGAPRL